jgi:transcriptional regulator with XRE-family HTH domain
MKQKSPHPINLCIGQQMKLRRKVMGLSQEALGKLMGMTFQQVQKYERGTDSMSAWRLFELAQIMDVSPMYFYSSLENEDSISADNLTTQSIHLMRDFNAIPSAKIRQSITAFVREVSKGGRNGL